MKPELQLINNQIACCDKALEKLKSEKAEPPKLNFKPNENLGEGQAGEEELEYRQSLLDLLANLHNSINKVIFTDKTHLDKIKLIDKLINSFISDGQELADETIPKTWDDGVKEGIKQLKKLNSKNKYNIKSIDTTKKELIHQQQHLNIQKIGINLKLFILINFINDHKTPTKSKKSVDKATPKPTWTECMRQLNKEDPSLTEEELIEWCDEWNSGFIDAQNNLDKAGLFGWLETHKEALLGTLIMGVGIIGDLIADWVSVGDENVCDECLDLEAKSPHHITEWPSDPHFGCRCEQQNIRLASLE